MCPECAYEWNPAEVEVTRGVVKDDANGNNWLDIYGDLTKDLKVKGCTGDLNRRVRVKNIRIVEGDHNIDCKIDGFGNETQSEFVKKISNVHKINRVV